MKTVFELLVMSLLTGTLLLLERSQGLWGLLLAAAGDEDMKIASGSFAPAPEGELSDAEAAAKVYLRQKSLGNVDKARALGQDLARALSQEAEQGGCPKPRGHHRLVLFSYVVNRVIADLSPNSILAQTALNVFYDQVEEHSPALAEEIRDMAAYSLYILCERSETRAEDSIGGTYARLCGDEKSRELAEEGNSLYRGYYEACARLYQTTDYVKA